MEELDLTQIAEVIKSRKSVQIYKSDWNDEVLINKIVSYCDVINESKGPFGTKIKVQVISLDNDVEHIKGANHYVIASVDKTDYNFFDLGYLFEKVIIYITSLNLGTALLDVSSSDEQFGVELKHQDNNEVLLASPFGLSNANQSVFSKFKKKADKTEKFEKLFFDVDLMPVDTTLCGDYIKVLEAIRLAPSTLSKQPTRVVSDPHNGLYHFYNATTEIDSDINLGIALCHFELMMNEQFIFGSIINSKNNALPNYKFTWKEAR